MELNTIEQIFKCEYCNYVTKRKGHLKRHLSYIHDIGVKWVYCEEKGCEYKCKQKGHLKKHLLYIHNIGVTWYYCDEKGCDSKFKQEGHLKRHIKLVHDKIKDFECELCDSKFSENSDLKKHIDSVHKKIKDFECDYEHCEFKTAHRGNLNAHIKTAHNKIKNFECKVCDKKFGRKGHLERHISICTGNRHISGGEYKVLQALSEFGFVEGKDFYHDSTYDKLTNFCGKNLRFDFRFINHKVMIEYDGKQHFEPVEAWGGVEQLQKIQEYDGMKNDFCKENDYKLIRILYKDFTNILEILSKELNDIIDWTG